MLSEPEEKTPMSLNGAYDDENVFARIVRGEIPKALIAEDEVTMAFMDAFPQSRGHCLVIHKFSKARNLLEAEPGVAEALIGMVKRVTRAVRSALEPDGIVVTQFNGSAAGQTVFHLHFHVIPRWEGVALGRHASHSADPAQVQDLARQIGERMRE
jgi:histidine triad (HIT) family protein